MHQRHAAVFIIALAALGPGACARGGEEARAAQDAGAPDPRIGVREGFELTVAARLEGRARFVAVGDDATLYVSDPDRGVITALQDRDADGAYEARAAFVEGYRTVHGLAFHDGWLWFTQSGAIHKARDTDADGVADEVQTVIPEGPLPSGGGHWWRSVAIHDGRLYTSIGDSGNITDETGTERQKIWSFNLWGRDKRLFCSGIRNTEKLVVRPGTDELWGMDHGSDWFGRHIGDDQNAQPVTDLNPPDEMNRYVEGGFYGHPFIVGDKLPRYEYLDRDDIIELAERTIPPEWKTGAHWAPNAMCFYEAPAADEGAAEGARAAGAFPADFEGDAIVAYHGSWNRSRRSGYQVTRVRFEDGKPWGEQWLVTFLGDDDARGQPTILGRPVDVAVDRDGSLLISEDGQNRIYRLRWVGRDG